MDKNSEDFEIDENDLKKTLTAFTGINEITKKSKNVFNVQFDSALEAFIA